MMMRHCGSQQPDGIEVITESVAAPARVYLHKFCKWASYVAALLNKLCVGCKLTILSAKACWDLLKRTRNSCTDTVSDR